MSFDDSDQHENTENRCPNTEELSENDNGKEEPNKRFRKRVRRRRVRDEGSGGDRITKKRRRLVVNGDSADDHPQREDVNDSSDALFDGAGDEQGGQLESSKSSLTSKESSKSTDNSDLQRKHRKVKPKRQRSKKAVADDSLGSQSDVESHEERSSFDEGVDDEAEGMWNALVVSTVLGKTIRVEKRSRQKVEDRNCVRGDDFFLNDATFEPLLMDLTPQCCETPSVESDCDEVFTHDSLQRLGRIAREASEKQQEKESLMYQARLKAEKAQLGQQAVDMKSRALAQRAEESKLIVVHMLQHLNPTILTWTTPNSDGPNLPYVNPLNGFPMQGKAIEEQRKHFWTNHHLSIQWCRSHGLIQGNPNNARSAPKTVVNVIWDLLAEHYPQATGIAKALTACSEEEKLYYSNFASQNGLMEMSKLHCQPSASNERPHSHPPENESSNEDFYPQPPEYESSNEDFYPQPPEYESSNEDEIPIDGDSEESMNDEDMIRLLEAQ
eukprot:GHVH01005786.1.p1 GENE.GHVH01005786.1~~GHVH01005786.1.p1  ORF type:complete len:498 (-),score=89.57 GHVH01005786.1:1950-3443(-)